MATESWFSRGAQEAQQTRKAMASSFKPTFWIKDGEEAEVVFLDEEGLNCWVHRVNVAGKFKNYTCLRKGCPLCAAGNDPRFITIYRILDTRTYVGKDGKKHVNEERYFEVGSKLQEILELLIKKGRLFQRVVCIMRKGSELKTVYNAMPVGKPKFELPVPKLHPEVDYKPKSMAELESLAEAIGGYSRRSAPPAEETEPPARRSYYEDDEEAPPVPPRRATAADEPDDIDDQDIEEENQE